VKEPFIRACSSTALLIFLHAFAVSSAFASHAAGTVVAWDVYSNVQAQVPHGLTNVVAIAAGDHHRLVLRADGTVVAWGSNRYGQTNVPPGLTNIVAIAAGRYHSLALQRDGTVVGWGLLYLHWPRCPDEASCSPLFVPATAPAGLSNVVAIAGGGAHCLALKSDGTVVGWGSYWDHNSDDHRPMVLPAGCR